MAVGVAMAITQIEHLLQKWEFGLCHFCPDKIYVYGEGKLPASQVLQNAVRIQSPADLPAHYELVVLAPPNGANVQGVTPLTTFAHPPHAVYWFGSDSAHLESEMFAVRPPDHLVYIPTDTIDQMYSFVAWAVVGWDRRQKG